MSKKKIKLRSELKKFILNNTCKIAHKMATIKLEETDAFLVEETSTKKL